MAIRRFKIVVLILLSWVTLPLFAETLTNSLNTEAKNPESSNTSSYQGVMAEDFQGLISQRKKVLINQSALESELRKLQEERKFLPRSIQDIDTDTESIKIQNKRDKETIAELEKKKLLSQEEQEQLEKLKSYVSGDEQSLRRNEQDKARIIDLEKKISATNAALIVSQTILAPIEQRIADVLNIEEERNDFRKLISITFCVLVGIVIIGFYSIAYVKDGIAESIFSGEKGIQFVTIFLIVIAIILFGIMGILESKELSALLGGLSGYILGRVSNPSK